MSDIEDEYRRNFEQWSTWTKQDIKDDKGTIAIINALSVVVRICPNVTVFSDSWLIFAQAAFIAGVQGQILTICVNVNVTNGAGKKRATICAFVGLLLDILGASIGVVHTLLLKQRVNDNAQILSLITAFKDEADLFALNINQETGENIVEVKIAKDGLPDGRRQKIEDLSKKMDGRFHLNRVSENYDRVTNILDYSSGPFEVISALMTVRFWFTTLMVSQKTSSVPLAAMGLGVGCLLLSVIFLAEGIAGPTSGEFLACVVAVGMVFVTLCFTIMFVKFLLTCPEDRQLTKLFFVALSMKFYTFLFTKVKGFRHRRCRNNDAELGAGPERRVRREEYEKRDFSVDLARQQG
jgi:hypothetical protein